MVDTPVGKKCRSCAQPRTHLLESDPRQVAAAFLGAVLTAFVGGIVVQQVGFFLLAFPYGWLVGEVALRAGQRRRSLAMQIATGCAAVLGSGAAGALVFGGVVRGEQVAWGFQPAHLLNPITLVMMVIATSMAVYRVRFL